MQAAQPSPDATDPALATDRDADRMDATTISRLLASSPEPWQVRIVDTTGSTNTDLLADVRRTTGGDLPALLVARHQSAGRGRMGRVWESTGGQSLTVSFGLRIARRIGLLEGVTLVCGLAVADVVVRLGIEVHLKWPNDVLVGHRKLAGILVEAHALGASTALVVGVGMNLAGVEAPVGGVDATSLRDEGIGAIDRAALVADIALALAERLAAFGQAGFAPSVAAWRARDAYAGRAVVIRADGESPIAGRHAGIDASGALLIDTGGGQRRFTGGDISVRLAP